MQMKLRRIFLLIVTICVTVYSAKSQDTFYGEVGVTGGGGFVLGDTNDFLFKYTQPVGGAYLKYKINGRWETRLQLDGGLLGYSEGQKTPYIGLQALGEFNFFNYGVKRWEAHYSWFTPSLVAGLGLFSCLNDEPKFTATIPLGLGVKFKLSNRINLGAYWMVSKVISDKVDNKPNPNGEYGRWNNQDWYSTAQIALSVNFYKICAPCRSGKGKPNGKYIWTY
jgi:hypothetical protein